MFDLGPEKIMTILVAVCIFLGPKEIPAAARRIGAVTRQLRSWQDTLRAEVSSALSIDDEPSAIPARTTRAPADESDPSAGDSFV